VEFPFANLNTQNNS